MRSPTAASLRPKACLLVAAALAIAACQPAEDADNIQQNAAEEPVLNLPAVPLPEPPLGRADLLRAVRQAASATAAGIERSPELRALDGRPFELRIRFGCRGPSTELEQEWLGWSFDPKDRTVRVRAMPTISKDEPLVGRIGVEGFEAVEGFWIPRPWLLQPVCPAAAAVRAAPPKPPEGDTENTTAAAPADDAPKAEAEAASEPIPTWPRVGIAQYFTADDPRTRRRSMRPYQSVHTLEEGAPIGSQGFDLVLSGRLRALPEREVIECAARNADSPPECIISAQFDRVWIEQPVTKELIAEWGGG